MFRPTKHIMWDGMALKIGGIINIVSWVRAGVGTKD